MKISYNESNRTYGTRAALAMGDPPVSVGVSHGSKQWMEKARITLHLESGAQQAHAANTISSASSGQLCNYSQCHALLPLAQLAYAS
jgi:hypothetical protein